MSQVQPSPYDNSSVSVQNQRIGFGLRFVASLLDGIILIPVMFLAIPMVIKLESQGKIRQGEENA